MVKKQDKKLGVGRRTSFEQKKSSLKKQKRTITLTPTEHGWTNIRRIRAIVYFPYHIKLIISHVCQTMIKVR